MKLATFTPMKLLLPLTAAVVVLAGCSQNKVKENTEEVKNFTERVYDNVMNNKPQELEIYRGEDGCLYFRDLSDLSPTQMAAIDTNRLNEIRDSVANKTANDSITFVNKENKTYQDTVAMLASFENRDKTNEAVNYLKEQRAIALNNLADREVAKQEEIDSIKAVLEKRM